MPKKLKKNYQAKNFSKNKTSRAPSTSHLKIIVRLGISNATISSKLGFV